MTEKLSFLLFLLMASATLWAQEKITFKKHSFEINDHWTFDPATARDGIEFSIQHLEAPFPGGEKHKSEQAARKELVAEKFPRVPSPEKASRDTSDTMTVLESFPLTHFIAGTVMGGGTPNDNTLAISNDGLMVTSYNSSLWGKDIEADTLLFAPDARHPSFALFMKDYSDTSIILSFPFDPKLMYDASRNRFIFTFLTGRDPSNSGVILAFSSTNNPSDMWHVYRLSGNPLNDNTWTDYPQIAITENELFYSLNQLYPDSSWITGFAQTVIWQIDLNDGFAGNPTLDVDLWSDIMYNGSKLRYLHPVKNSLGTTSNDMYFVANRPFDIQNDSVFLARITGEMSSNPTMEMKLLQPDLPYGLPPSALQPEGHFLLTNDARTLGAVRIDNSLQFVGNTVDTATGKCAIYHGTIDDVTATQPSIHANYIVHSDWDLGYPNIAFTGTEQYRDGTAIFFDYTSANEYAGNGITYYDNGTYFPLQRLIEGETKVDRMPNEPDRWGDYSGIQRRYNQDGVVWVAGYFGTEERSATWVSSLVAPGYPVPLDSNIDTTDIDTVYAVEPVTGYKPTTVFPNPVQEKASVVFYTPQSVMLEFALYDLQGRKMQVLARDRVKAGKNEFSFNTGFLPTGTYILSITGPGVAVKEKIIRN